ncbi:MAG: carboxypeptidase-like regulatory domain-containing protein [Planctomycetota bacterium]
MNRQRSLFVFGLAIFVILVLAWTALLDPQGGENPTKVNVDAAQLEPQPDSAIKQSASTAVRRDSIPQEANLALSSESLSDKKSLKVLVQSPSGQAKAEIPVSLWKFEEDHFLPWKIETTNLQGHAEFALQPYQVGKDFTMVVGFAFPCGKARSVKFLRSELPTTTVLLVLAATGRVEVQLLDEKGEPWLFPTEVRCSPTSETKAVAFRTQGYAGPGLVSLTTDKNGRVSFPCVSGESSHTASVFAKNFGDWDQTSFAAPKPNRTTKLDLQLLQANPRATFRILKPDGTPLVQHAWSGWLNQISIEEGNNWTWTYSMAGRTDSEGYAAIAITDSLVGKIWTSRDLVIEAVFEGTEPALRARRETLSAELASSPFLGDFRLEPASIFVAGYVFSTSGLPIEGVKIETQEELIVSTQVRTESKFTPTPTQTILHEDGSFQLLGSVRPKVLHLMVSAPGFHAQEVVADVGDANLEIRLEPSLIVSGQLEGLSKETLEKTRVHYLPPGAEVAGYIRTGNVVTQTPDSEGRFLLSGLEPAGDGKVQVFIQHSDSPFLEVEEISPWAFDANPDARLHPLLAKEPYLYRVYLKTPEGEIALGAKHDVVYAFGMPDKADSTFAQTVDNGFFETYAATEELALKFYHQKYRPISATVKPGRFTLTFKDPILVRVEISDLPSIPSDMRLIYRVESEASNGTTKHSGQIRELIPENLAVVPVPAAGTYLLSFLVMDTESFFTREDVLWPSGEKTQKVEVLDQPDQVFSLSFPYVGIQEAIESLRNAR